MLSGEFGAVRVNKKKQKVPKKKSSLSFKAETVYSGVDRLDKSSFCFQTFANNKQIYMSPLWQIGVGDKSLD